MTVWSYIALLRGKVWIAGIVNEVWVCSRHIFVPFCVQRCFISELFKYTQVVKVNFKN